VYTAATANVLSHCYAKRRVTSTAPALKAALLSVHSPSTLHGLLPGSKIKV
jgi:hypothetical protein